MKNVYKALFSLLFVLSLTGCSVVNKNLLDVSNDFDSLIEEMVDESASKLQKNLGRNSVVLVSDFVNLDNLQNHSKLGFLLSDTLKNELLKKDIIVRQVELGREFTLGKHGFNVLTRNQEKISSPEVNEAEFAVVGTYSVTTKRLIVFIKLMDIRNGHILSSSSNSVIIDEEIRELESTKAKQPAVYTPMTL